MHRSGALNPGQEPNRMRPQQPLDEAEHAGGTARRVAVRHLRVLAGGFFAFGEDSTFGAGHQRRLGLCVGRFSFIAQVMS